MDIPDSILPHGHEPVTITGNTANPTRALVLLHGRGASAANIMNLADQLSLSSEYLVAAPQAQGNTWYPERFIVPTIQNQPHLDSALDKVATILTNLKESFGIDPEQITLAGFSQGACLVAEFIKRNPTRYQGLAIFSGGLIGDEVEVSQSVAGDFKQTPIYLGCDQADFHIPKERVEQSAKIFTAMNAQVELKLYENLGHSIHEEGIAALQNFLPA